MLAMAAMMALVRREPVSSGFARKSRYHWVVKPWSGKPNRRVVVEREHEEHEEGRVEKDDEEPEEHLEAAKAVLRDGDVAHVESCRMERKRAKINVKKSTAPNRNMDRTAPVVQSKPGPKRS